MTEDFRWNEFLAAGFGAMAALALDGARRWRERTQIEQDAANQALLTLAQMFTSLENIRQQVYEDREKHTRQLMQREPHAIEILPMTGLKLILEAPRVQDYLATRTPFVSKT